MSNLIKRTAVPGFRTPLSAFEDQISNALLNPNRQLSDIFKIFPRDYAKEDTHWHHIHVTGTLFFRNQAERSAQREFF